MPSPLRDLLQAWRGLTHKPGFLIAVLLTVAVGIGANVTIFSLVNAIALRPMPFGERTERLVTINPAHRLLPANPGWGHSEISYRDLLDFRTAASVEGIGAYFSRSYVLTDAGVGAERVRGGSVTADLFPLLGIEPLLGRHFREDEAARPGLETVVMLTHGLWQRRYSADPAIVGKAIVVNDRPRVVVGVLPPGVRFPERDEIYTPLNFDQTPRSARNVNAVALLRRGGTIEQARAELDTIAASLEAAYPDTNRGFGVRVFPLRRSFVGPDSTRTALVLMAAVAFVLLIMCANLANLMLVRGLARQREIAVRAAMGASRRRLMWTAISESIVIAVPGALLGVLAAQWAIDGLAAALPLSLPYWVEIGIDTRVTLFTIGATVFTILVVGVLPSTRAARANLVNDLKEGARTVSLGRGAHHVQSALAIVQVALCFGLLVGANLMVRSFLEMRRAGLGFDERPIVSAGGYLAGDAFDDVRTRAAFFRNVTTTLATLPGASAAAVISAVPGDDGGSGRRLVTDERMGEADDIVAEAVAIGPSLFDVIGVTLLEGRPFTEQEAENPDAEVAILNERLARRLWPGTSAVDRRIGFRGDEGVRWLRVIGVAPDVHYREIGRDTEQSRLTVYIPYAMEGSRSMAMLVRASGAAEPLVAPMRGALQKAGPTFAISRVMPMQELRRRTTFEEQLFGNLMAAFAAAALLLACLGIYALIAYSVGRRSHEIGVRLALGARPADVIHMMLRETAAVGGIGLLVGLMLALLIARALVGTLYGVSFDAWLFVSMALPLAAAILAATWVPARRAARVEPTAALRDA
jgi:putative ABC transport system permease protein